MLGPREIRDLFMLDPSVVFLNNGSFGAVPRAVFEEQERVRREMEAEPVLFLARALDGRLADVRAEVAALVGVTDPDAVALVPNTTTALNAVAMSFDLAPGDEVVVTSHEYGAMTLLWDEVARLTGATVRIAALPEPMETAEAVVDAIGAAISSRTRVLFMSHITSLTAAVLPVERLCGEARRLGIVSVVDGAHAPGQLPLDLETLGADVYAGNLHKWCCSPRGSAFLHARDEIRPRIRGPIVSWGWSWDGPASFQGRFGWMGTDDPTALLAIPAALAFRREHAWESQVEACRERLGRLLGELEREVGAVPVAAPELRAPQFASVHVELRGREPAEVQRLLWERRIEVPVEPIGRFTVVRPSVQAFVSDEDCSALVEGLRAVL